jgi:DNA polymerase III alpha subunit
MIYEDDVLRVLQALTGLPAVDADRFRKRVAKHRTEEEARRLAEEFTRLCDRNGVPRSVTTELWPHVAKFNRYAFCKSHSVSYGLIAWRAAWLKTHHPLAFWTAALNNNQGMYSRRVYIEAVKRAGIEVRLPCVNRSRGPFSVEDDAIRVGLDAIASLEQEFRTALVAERERCGPYRDLVDFRQRLQPGPETLSLLIRSGALDFTGQPRPALFLQAELQDSARTRPGDASLFPGAGSLFPADAWSPSDYAAERRWQEEWELLGFVTGPPLLSLCRGRLPRGLLTSRDLPDHVGRVVRLAGVVATSRQATTEAGKPMQFVTLEDEWGLFELTLFPDTCPLVAYPTLGPYVVTGVVEEQYGVLTITARRFELVGE